MTSYGFSCLRCGNRGPHGGIRSGRHVLATCSACLAEHLLEYIPYDDGEGLEMIGIRDG